MATNIVNGRHFVDWQPLNKHNKINSKLMQTSQYRETAFTSQKTDVVLTKPQPKM